MNIYIGNLEYSVSESDLQGLFEQYGAVSSVKVIKDQDSGRSKGFGFVEMEQSNDGEEAVKNLDGHNLNGRNMKVNQARPKTSNGGGGRNGGGQRRERQW